MNSRNYSTSYHDSFDTDTGYDIRSLNNARGGMVMSGMPFATGGYFSAVEDFETYLNTTLYNDLSSEIENIIETTRKKRSSPLLQKSDYQYETLSNVQDADSSTAAVCWPSPPSHSPKRFNDGQQQYHHHHHHHNHHQSFMKTNDTTHPVIPPIDSSLLSPNNPSSSLRYGC